MEFTASWFESCTEEKVFWVAIFWAFNDHCGNILWPPRKWNCHNYYCKCNYTLETHYMTALSRV